MKPGYNFFLGKSWHYLNVFKQTSDHTFAGYIAIKVGMISMAKKLGRKIDVYKYWM